MLSSVHLRTAAVTVIALLLAGLVPTSPAHAAVRLTLSASSTTVAPGAEVTLTGRTARGTTGKVQMQRRADSGWRAVAERRIAQRRAEFVIRPPRGVQRYRLVLPGTDGNLDTVSEPVRLLVQWRPAVRVDSHSDDVDVDTGTVSTTIIGTTRRLPAGATLHRELQQPDGGYVAVGRVTVQDDGGWKDRFDSRDGERLRYAVRATRTRLATASLDVVVDGTWTPTITAYPSVDPLTAEVSVTGTTRGLAGHYVQRWIRDLGTGDWTLVDIGVRVADDGSFTDGFPLLVGRSYEYRADADGPRLEAASSIFTLSDLPTTRVLTDQSVGLTFPKGGPTRRLVLELDAGRTYSFWRANAYYDMSVLAPDGSRLLEFEADDTARTTVVPRTGDYTVVLHTRNVEELPSTATIAVSRAIDLDVDLDDAGHDLRTMTPGQVVDLHLTAEVGMVLSEYAVVAPHFDQPNKTLIAPSGAVVARWGEKARVGKVWVPLVETGEYVVRLRGHYDHVFALRQQALLTAQVVQVSVDGTPAHLSFDRLGRVGVAQVTVPGGTQVRISNRSNRLTTETLAPDGRSIDYYDNIIDLPTTEPGTFSQLLSVEPRYEGLAPDVDVFASSPLHLDATVGARTTFEAGPAVFRKALISVPVSAGQLFTMNLSGQGGVNPCFTWSTLRSGEALLHWHVSGEHPELFSVRDSGVLVLEITLCGKTNGTLEFVPAAVTRGQVTDVTSDTYGRTTTTTTATMQADVPGQVMLLGYDAGQGYYDEEQLAVFASTFPDGTEFDYASLNEGWLTSRTVGRDLPVPAALLLDTTYEGPALLVAYAGPTATGSLDVRLRVRG